MRFRFRLLFLALGIPSAVALAAPGGWITTWSRGPSLPYSDPTQLNSAHLVFSNQTLRNIVHTSVGGGTVRVRLSNVYGASAVEIGAAHIALETSASSIDPTSDRTLTFSGRPDVTIPPDAILLSDPIAFNVPASGNLAISLFIPNTNNGAGIHYLGVQTSYLGAGDQTSAATLRTPTSISFWAFLTGVDVMSSDPAAATVVTLGDSITDGANSTTGANHRWPDFLANRLLAAGIDLGVANSGISGNRILHDALLSITAGVNAVDRFGRDVLEQPGAEYLIILLGINDIGQPGTTSAPITDSVSAADVIWGLQQMADRAHEMGLQVFGCTLTPFAVATSADYYSTDKDATRQAVNAWIRSGVAFDAVIDFDLAVRDPNNPLSYLPAYDSGDHLHPNDAGYQAMANAIDLTLFQSVPQSTAAAIR
jgi:lysophospholipase L1-like esterase